MQFLTNTHIKNLKYFLQNIIWLSVLVFVLSKCQKPYFNDKLAADEKIPVFSALLTNIDAINTFELYYAKPYTESIKERIEGAIITIESNDGNYIQVEEAGPGLYKIENAEAFLEFNKNYTATIQLSDGRILKSKPMVYHDTLGIDNIYFDYNINTVIAENSSGDFIEFLQRGIFINVRLNEPTDTNTFYRTHSNYYVHSQMTVNKTKPYSYQENGFNYNFEISYDSVYDVLEGYTNTSMLNAGTLSSEIEYTNSGLTSSPIFLEADQERVNFSRYTSNTFVQWIFPVDVFTTSYDVYNYYSDANNQLNAPERIYDPIPEQIIGNIHNETNPDEVALGLFDVSSVSRRYYAVYVHEAFGYRSYRGRHFNDTVFRSGNYLNWSRVDTVFIDSTIIE